MRLAFDGQIYRFQRAGGINQYFAQIIQRLPDDWEPVLLGASDFGTHTPRHPRLRVCDGPYFWPGRISQALRQARWQRLFATGCDLVHPTYYDLSDQIDISRLRCPVVVTVYDLIHARYSQLMEGADVFLRLQREAVERADHVICISRATEADLHATVPASIGKTSVIYLGSSLPVSDRREPASDRPPAFIFVGTRGQYKNFDFALRTFAAAASVIPSLRLHVAGPPLTSHERWQIHLLGLESRVEAHVFPDEATLLRLYQDSLALLYPSHHEGFGIPPLEAMSCGTVAVTSNSTSLPEVVGQGGIMLDPNDASAWTECMLALARRTIDIAGLVSRGYVQARAFSWERSAAEHVAVYRRLARR